MIKESILTIDLCIYCYSSFNEVVSSSYPGVNRKVVPRKGWIELGN